MDRSGLELSMPERGAAADHVIGTFPRAALSAALAATHRAGFGPHTRVLDGARGDVARQLARTGLELIAGEQPAADNVLIVVTAPGRTTVVTDLFAQLGAESVLLAARRKVERQEPSGPTPHLPDIRIGNETGAVPEV